MKSLKDYTDRELYEVLENNMSTNLNELSGICAEVLRRILKKDLTIKEVKMRDKLWFKASEARIFDLNVFDLFWLESRPDEVIVFASSLSSHSNYQLESFTSDEDAIKYLDKIFDF